jgi:hypothetical protein
MNFIEFAATLPGDRRQNPLHSHKFFSGASIDFFLVSPYGNLRLHAFFSMRHILFLVWESRDNPPLGAARRHLITEKSEWAGWRSLNLAD